MPSAFIRFHFFQSIGFHLVSVYSVPSFFQSMGFRLFSVYGAISCFSLWGSIFVNSAFKTFNTYSRLDLFYSRQTFLCVLAFNLLRQLPQSGIFHLSFVKPAHIQSTHLLETKMSRFFHQISPYQVTNAAKKNYEKLER